jgi:lysophospholipase L1-like esterase
MRRLTDRLRKETPNAHLVVTSVLPVGPRLRRYAPSIDDLNLRLRDLCSDGRCVYLDVAGEFEMRGLGRDDLHLNETGYARWAAVLKRDTLAVARD